MTGIDNSKVGIDQMISISEQEGLKLTGLVGDIYVFDKYQDFDIVLLDSLLHFEKRELKRETALIDKIAKQINKNGLICVCIQDTGKKVRILKDTIGNSSIDFEILNDSSLIYKYKELRDSNKSETKYCMYIMLKKN